MLSRVICLFIGYACGLFLSGFIIGKFNHVDVTKKGSGNVGSTNTLRTVSVGAGFLTLVLDVFKALMATFFVWFIFHNKTIDNIHILELYACFGAVLGHDFPFYMKFKGGKGIATSFGLMIAIFPQTIPICAIVFFVTVFISRYVSLASILSAIVFPIQVIVFCQMGWIAFSATDYIEASVISVMVAILAVVLHHANIYRLLHGIENKFTFHSKDAAQAS